MLTKTLYNKVVKPEEIAEGENPTKPVAYDPYGRPLYAHPPQVVKPQPEPSPSPGPQTSTPQDASGKPQVVYMTRAIDPHQQKISPEIHKRHNQSKRKYPHLNLSEGEFVISAVRRHPIGLVSIWIAVVVAVLIVLVLPTSLFALGFSPIALSGEAVANGLFVILMMSVLAVLAGVVGTIVYESNRFYLTNESVIQHIQTSLFSKKDQTISLGNVEDASFRQSGILQTILNYGSIRLSTEGEETTYRFNLVANPKEQIRLLNDAVEAFKNFRPIDPDDD